MARRHDLLLMDDMSLVIPADAHTFEGFWRWVESDEFPESGRIDFLGGEIEADMSPEDLYTQGALKVEVVAVLVELVKRTGLGDVQADRSRFRSPFATVTTEPDVVAVFRESIEDTDGWRRSPRLDRAFRLVRFHQPPFPWSYRLEHRGI